MKMKWLTTGIPTIGKHSFQRKVKKQSNVLIVFFLSFLSSESYHNKQIEELKNFFQDYYIAPNHNLHKRRPLTTSKVGEIQIAYINPDKNFEVTVADATKTFDILVS
jgi:hypothetical protein